MSVVRIAALVAFGLAMTDAAAQRRISIPHDPTDVGHSFFVGLHSWINWPLESGVEPTLQLVASEALWSRAAVLSPTAAYYLAAFQTQPWWFAHPLGVRHGHSFSCGRRLATTAAVMERVAGITDPEAHVARMPPLQPGELYHVELTTSYTGDLPQTMHFTTRRLLVPLPVEKVGELIVQLAPDPLHWVPVHLSRAEAPVMRVAQVEGYQRRARATPDS